MKFKLHEYIIPSVVSMLVVGTNANIDGIFIGRLLGDDGLAAINIVWPIVAFIVAIGTGIGVGGAVILNELRGSGKSTYAEKIKNTTLSLMLIASGVITALFLLFYSQLPSLLGASGNVLTYSKEYAFVISMGAIAQIVGAGILVLLRNDGKSYYCMIYSVIGLALHLIFDIVLLKPLGMYGVALATVISQAVIAVLGLFTISIDKKVGIDFAETKNILVSSIAPLGINFVPSLVLMFTNYFALKCGGVAAVSAYALMCYVVYTFDYIFQGVCDGVQPIISYCYGAKDTKQEYGALKCSALIILIMSVVFVIITPLLIKIMLAFFSVSSETKSMFQTGLVIFMFSYLFKGGVKYICSYFYAIQNTGISNILVFADPLVLTPLLLHALSNRFGVNGVWVVLPVSQLVVFAVGIVIFVKKLKRR